MSPARRDGAPGRLRLDAQGWMRGARRIPSPNRDSRPAGTAVNLVVVHAISLPPGRFGGEHIERLFTNRLDPKGHPYFAQVAGLRVSAHLLIRRDGTLIQFVPCVERAWHAGASSWRGRERCNDFSIGIELEGADDQVFEDPQYDVLGRVVRALWRRFPIEDIVGHSDVSPDRKTDPGPLFDWLRLAGLLARSRP